MSDKYAETRFGPYLWVETRVRARKAGCRSLPASVRYAALERRLLLVLPGARGVEGKRTAASFREYCAMIIPTLRVVPSLRRQEDQDELVNVLEVKYGSRPGFIEPGYTYAGLVEAWTTYSKKVRAAT